MYLREAVRTPAKAQPLPAPARAGPGPGTRARTSPFCRPAADAAAPAVSQLAMVGQAVGGPGARGSPGSWPAAAICVQPATRSILHLLARHRTWRGQQADPVARGHCERGPGSSRLRCARDRESVSDIQRGRPVPDACTSGQQLLRPAHSTRPPPGEDHSPWSPQVPRTRRRAAGANLGAPSGASDADTGPAGLLSTARGHIPAWPRCTTALKATMTRHISSSAPPAPDITDGLAVLQGLPRARPRRSRRRRSGVGHQDPRWNSHPVAHTSSPLSVLSSSWYCGHSGHPSRGGVVFSVARREGRARTWLLAVLAAAAVLGPAEQAWPHTATLLNEHVRCGRLARGHRRGLRGRPVHRRRAGRAAAGIHQCDLRDCAGLPGLPGRGAVLVVPGQLAQRDRVPRGLRAAGRPQADTRGGPLDRQVLPPGRD